LAAKPVTAARATPDFQTRRTTVIPPVREWRVAVAALCSVIMPNYQGERYISEAIRSLQSQTLEDWELLVCDDGSTDDSLPILREFASRDSRIRVLTSKGNEGPAKARNA